jgi:DNA-binding IscR family transcriptional regulator
MQVLSKTMQYTLRVLFHLVDSRMGWGGGYFLVRPPDEISVGSIIRRMEGPLAALPRASETAFRKCDECVDVETYVTAGDYAGSSRRRR